jgi:hypothetical protein
LLLNFSSFCDLLVYIFSYDKNYIFLNKLKLKNNFFYHFSKYNYIKKKKNLKKRKILLKYFFFNRLKNVFKIFFRTSNFFFKYTTTNFFLSFYQKYIKIQFLKKKRNFFYIDSIIPTSLIIINNIFKSNIININYFNYVVNFFYFKNIFKYHNIPNINIIDNLKYKILFFISAGFGGYKKKERRTFYRTKKMLETFKEQYVPLYFKYKMDFFYFIINGISKHFYKYFKFIRLLLRRKYRSLYFFFRNMRRQYITLKIFVYKCYKKQRISYNINRSTISKTIKFLKYSSYFQKSKLIFYNNLYFFFFNSIFFYKQLYQSLFFEILFLFLFKLFFLNKTMFNIIEFISNNNF